MARTSATVTSKGQVTIPLAVRTELGLRAGSRLAFIPTARGFEIHVEAGSIRDLKGAVDRPAEPVTLADMDEAIAAGAAAVDV